MPRSKLEEIEAYWKPAGNQDINWLLERVRELRVALRSVRTILQSDSIEYDDMLHVDQIIDAALAVLASPSDLADETPQKGLDNG